MDPVYSCHGNFPVERYSIYFIKYIDKDLSLFRLWSTLIMPNHACEEVYTFRQKYNY